MDIEVALTDETVRVQDVILPTVLVKAGRGDRSWESAQGPQRTYFEGIEGRDQAREIFA